ncbi:MAG: DUF2125 domain-containing protein, partial [Caulobacteraceae bacterium]
LAMAREVRTRLDSARAALIRNGGRTDWSGERVFGYPFRLDLDLRTVEIEGPAGFGIASPRLAAEAFVFAPGHWVAVFPEGASVGLGPASTVKIATLRASLFELDRSPPRLSIQADGLAFARTQGTPTFKAASAFHLHTRAQGDGTGALFVELDDARLASGGILGAALAAQPLTIAADLSFDHAGALAGASWPAAVRAWSAAGGRLEVRQIALTAGSQALVIRGGSLGVGSDGAFEGVLAGRLVEASRVAAGAAGEGGAAILTLSKGRLRLGPIDLAAAPRVF